MLSMLQSWSDEAEKDADKLIKTYVTLDMKLTEINSLLFYGKEIQIWK